MESILLNPKGTLKRSEENRLKAVVPVGIPVRGGGADDGQRRKVKP